MMANHIHGDRTVQGRVWVDWLGILWRAAVAGGLAWAGAQAVAPADREQSHDAREACKERVSVQIRGDRVVIISRVRAAAGSPPASAE